MAAPKNFDLGAIVQGP